MIEKSQKDRGTRTEYEPDKFAVIEDLIRRAVITSKKTLIYFPTVALIRRCYNQLHIDNMTAQVCYYHGSLTRDEKLESYEKFRSGEKLVMLATKAFGMGVDIPDIAIVSHFAPTGNVCDYVQEIGRAARDPKMRGEAYYQYNTHDFKHINTLHGLSKVQKYQLIEVIRKIADIYTENQGKKNDYTRKQRAMLLDAENFSYIFPSPVDDQDDSINKVKTALLMIQKDFEGKYGYSPIRVRPIPLFSIGYFQVDPAVQKRLNRNYPDCLTEIDENRHICRILLDTIWKADRDCAKHSFPQFKYLLYSRSSELELNRKYTLTPALSVSVSFQNSGSASYESIIASIKAFINKRIIDGTQAHIEEISKALAADCRLPVYKARTMCEVIFASMETYQRKYAKTTNACIVPRHDNAGRARYGFNVSVNSYFAWLEKHRETIRRETRDDTLYLVSDGSTMIQETAAVLGVLEALGTLTFRMIGGANSQIYIYINQIQTLENILKHPYHYSNRLLDTVAERHTVSVNMLTYLYENDFTSGQRWDLLEDYFLGRIPDEVSKAVKKEKEKQKKDPEWDG